MENEKQRKEIMNKKRVKRKERKNYRGLDMGGEKN